MEPKFTVEEIKKYISSQDSFGDALYFCNAKNIEAANAPKEILSDCCECEVELGVCTCCGEHV
jgi:hypothetical protein